MVSCTLHTISNMPNSSPTPAANSVPPATPALDGPYYDDLLTGYVFPTLPATTITEADNLQYRMITGNEHRLTADPSLYQAVSNSEGKLANPGLVLQLSIGQSTSATRKAIANLFYRGVLLQRSVEIGERIETTTTVLALCDARAKGDLNRGKVLLGIWTHGDNGPIAQYQRCALLPCRGEAPGHAEDVGSASSGDTPDYAGAIPTDWNLSELPDLDWDVSQSKADIMWDHIDMAPALARMTFNQAIVHRSPMESAYGKRLVYGGHVIALAEASLTRLLPGMATIVGWGQCNHLGPAFEGDTVSFEHTLTRTEPAGLGQLLHMRTIGFRQDGSTRDSAKATSILDWESVIYHR